MGSGMFLKRVGVMVQWKMFNYDVNSILENNKKAVLQVKSEHSTPKLEIMFRTRCSSEFTLALVPLMRVRHRFRLLIKTRVRVGFQGFRRLSGIFGGFRAMGHKPVPCRRGKPRQRG